MHKKLGMLQSLTGSSQLVLSTFVRYAPESIATGARVHLSHVRPPAHNGSRYMLETRCKSLVFRCSVHGFTRTTVRL